MLNRVAVAAGVVVGVGAGAWGQSSFTLIEPAPGYPQSRVAGISGDGRVVAGYSSTTNFSAVNSFTWTVAGGRADFGGAAGTWPGAISTAISGDGQTVTGIDQDTARIFRWSSSTGFQSIDGMSGYTDTFARAISGDGTVIAGDARNGGGTTPPVGPAFRWTEAGGYQSLGTLPGGGARVDVGGMSRDGNVIVGTNSQTGFGPLHSFIWTTDGGMQALEPSINSPFFESSGRGVSGDGLVAFGSGNVPGSSHPFRWTVADGMQDLGQPAGVSAPGIALFSNYDGSVIACSFNLAGDYLWRSGAGYVSIDTYFAQSGIALPVGYTNLDIFGISDNGRAFVGELTLQGIGRKGFVAIVPTPATAVIVAIGTAVAARRRRR